jgi:hypothetical protein
VLGGGADGVRDEDPGAGLVVGEALVWEGPGGAGGSNASAAVAGSGPSVLLTVLPPRAPVARKPHAAANSSSEAGSTGVSEHANSSALETTHGKGTATGGSVPKQQQQQQQQQKPKQPASTWTVDELAAWTYDYDYMPTPEDESLSYNVIFDPLYRAGMADLECSGPRIKPLPGLCLAPHAPLLTQLVQPLYDDDYTQVRAADSTVCVSSIAC